MGKQSVEELPLEAEEESLDLPVGHPLSPEPLSPKRTAPGDDAAYGGSHHGVSW